MPSLAAALRSLTHDVPPTLEMHGVFWMYLRGISVFVRGGASMASMV